MFLPKADRDAIYKQLYQEGVMIAERAPQKSHAEMKNLTNLHVIKTLQSMCSRGYVSEQLAWRHYYWCLNDKGIEFLRCYLNLPTEVVPSTLKRQRRAEPVRMARSSGGPRVSGKDGDERQSYRRTVDLGSGVDKKGNVGAGTGGMEFRGGFGRGKKSEIQRSEL